MVPDWKRGRGPEESAPRTRMQTQDESGGGRSDTTLKGSGFSFPLADGNVATRVHLSTAGASNSLG